MANVFRIKRRMQGPAGSPAETGYQVGEVIVNAQDATNPELWFFGGPTGGTAPNNKGFLRLNPKTTITTQSITLPAPSATITDIGAAYSAWNALNAATNVLTGNVVVATFGVPAQAYVLTNPAAPGTAASWTSLGGAVAFASPSEINGGSDTTKAINSAILRGETRQAPTNPLNMTVDAGRLPRLNGSGLLDPHFIPQAAPAGAGGLGGDVAQVILGITPNFFLTPQSLEMRCVHVPAGTGTRTADLPANDVNKIPVLDTTGKIPAGFLPAGGLTFKTGLDLTIAYPTGAAAPAPKPGDFYTVTVAGPVEASWATHLVTLKAGDQVAVGDMLVWDDTAKKFHHIANNVTPNAFVTKAGTSTMAADGRINFAAAAPAAGAAPGVIIDGGANMGSLENICVDCGVF